MIRLSKIERTYPLARGAFTVVLREVDLEVNEGDFISIMGPSGAGKSSLLHILGMHDHGWTGEFFFDDVAVHQLKPKERAKLRNEKVGFVFQNYHLLDDLTVYENLEIPLSYRHVSRSDRAAMVADTLDRFQIVGKKDLYPRQLSGGQQQLVGVARAIIAKPSLILADEPTGNLHSSQGEEIMELFKRLNDEGTTIVQVTHSEKNAGYGNKVIQLRTAGSFRSARPWHRLPADDSRAGCPCHEGRADSLAAATMDQGRTAMPLRLRVTADLIPSLRSIMGRSVFPSVAICSLLLGVALSSCAPKSEDLVEQVVEKTLSAGEAPRISIRNVDGAIRVYGSRGAEVKIQATKRAYGQERADKIVVSATGGPGSVDIDTTYPPKPKLSLSDRSGTVDYTIIVPQGSTIARLELTNGEVLLKDLRGGAVSAKLVNGRLVDYDSFGAHDLFVANGGLEIGWEWWEQRKFSVHSRVVSGSVRALIPTNASFRLKARAGSGKISNAFGDVPDQEKDGSQKLNVVVGSPSEAELELETTQGNIGVAEYSP